MPNWIDLTSAHVVALQNRPKLKEEFFNLITAVLAATPGEQVAARQIFEGQNDLINACMTGACGRVSSLIKSIGDAAIALGERLFNLLDELDIRKSHYEQIWKELKDCICPFCGYHELDAPELPAEDLDHYLSRKIYPFAAANLLNLAPMCMRCNMRYKGSKDILSGTGAIERHYPYDGGEPGTVELSGSCFFANGDSEPPAWSINLLPKAKEAEWNRIFRIKERYRFNFLDKEWMNWLERWVSVIPLDVPVTRELLCSELQTWRQIWSDKGLEDKAFLRSAYFSLVHAVLLQDTPESEQLKDVIDALIGQRVRFEAA